MASFTVYPAIDLRHGNVVRLAQGDPDRQTDYGDPVVVARRWANDGAQWLHMVNLDGAFAGRHTNSGSVACRNGHSELLRKRQPGRAF